MALNPWLILFASDDMLFTFDTVKKFSTCAPLQSDTSLEGSAISSAKVDEHMSLHNEGALLSDIMSQMLVTPPISTCAKEIGSCTSLV